MITDYRCMAIMGLSRAVSVINVDFSRPIVRMEEKVSATRSSTAIVKRFQTENIQFHPSSRLPFPLEFRNHMLYWQMIVVGLQDREKSLMISF